MRTEIINIYSFEELSEKAKQNAINNCRQECYEHGCDCDWDEVTQTLREIEKLTHVSVDIRYSTQGHYCNHYHLTDYYNDLTDAERFDRLKNALREYEDNTANLWCDFTAIKFLKDMEWDSGDYPRTIANAMAEMCNSIEYDLLAYLEDDVVEEYIEADCIDFLENGEVYGKF